MNIKQLTELVKNKLEQNITCEKIQIQDKTFLHKNHKTHDKKKFHLKLIITSNYLKKKNKIESTKEIYKILENELKNYIHSIQISIT
jgi:Stress-induced morphogen (activity unknown)|tara:strand:+ start:2403 stop:2663 length:261 start_codon:yes stop_codon:yes gene_type:complete